ncbi:MAG: nitrate reductase molybdenum cofactor assembly chaperone [Solirubrobacteraceae bacterium]
MRAPGRLRARRPAADGSDYKLCSLLLCYPDEELLVARAELSALAVASLPAVDSFCDWWCGTEPAPLQEHYVATFDLHRRCGLYLSYYEQGDRRDRGSGLLRLKRMYRAGGLPLADGELPDYLPAMLEFAAAAPDRWGEVMLREHRPSLALLAEGLRERGTPYADVVDAVCELVGPSSSADRARAEALAAAGPPTELVGLEPIRASQPLGAGR